MVDVMAFGAHPDDCELSMGGTLAVLKKLKHSVGVCDLSAGESGTYGSEEDRKGELAEATRILGLDARETLDLPDGNIRNTEENRLKVIEIIRRHRPRVVFGFVGETRHPDHHHAGELVRECYEGKLFNPVFCERSSTGGVYPATCRWHIEQKDPNCVGCKRCRSDRIE